MQTQKAGVRKRLIVFDFDYTLYDAQHWKELAYDELAALYQKDSGEFSKIAQEVYDETRKVGYFDPMLFATALSERFPESEKKATDIVKVIYSQDLFQKSYYPRVTEVLELLKDSFKLAIFSTNHDSFQEAKQQTVNHFFEQDLVFVSKNKQQILHKIVDLTKIYQVILVDDLVEILYAAKSESSEIMTVWIKQGPYATLHAGLDNFTPDLVVEKLSDLPDMIKNI